MLRTHGEHYVPRGPVCSTFFSLYKGSRTKNTNYPIHYADRISLRRYDGIQSSGLVFRQFNVFMVFGQEAFSLRVVRYLFEGRLLPTVGLNPCQPETGHVIYGPRLARLGRELAGHDFLWRGCRAVKVEHERAPHLPPAHAVRLHWLRVLLLQAVDFYVRRALGLRQ